MRAIRYVAVPYAAIPLCLAVAACDFDAVAPEQGTSLSLHVSSEVPLAAQVDGGMVRLEGPTPRNISIQPGETRTIEGLEPGPYTVSVEALSGTEVARFGQTNVTVVAGENRQANIVLRDFIPSFVNVPAFAAAGEQVDVQFGAVEGATNYLVEWASSATFSGAQTQTVTGTSATITLGTAEVYYVRVRARNRFGSSGVPATAEPLQAILSLTDGTPVQDLSGEEGSLRLFTVEVPSGSSHDVLQVRIQGGEGDADLLLRRGALPTPDAYDCASVAEPGALAGYVLDFCSVLNPQSGTWYGAVFGYTDYAGVTLDATFLSSTPLLDGAPRTGLSGGVNDILYFEFNVPQGSGSQLAMDGRQTVIAGSDLLDGPQKGRSLERSRAGQTATLLESQAASAGFTLGLSGGTGDADLLAAPRSSGFGFSDVPDWPCVSTVPGNDESCVIEGPEPGAWTVLVLGFEAFSGVTLEGRVETPEPVVLWDNGGFVTHPSAGYQGANVSMASADVNSGGQNVRHQPPDPHFRIADDFTVSGGTWNVSNVVTFAYETNVATPGWQSGELIIWNGPPGASGSQILGFTSAVNWVFTGVYRVFHGTENLSDSDRAIHAVFWDLGSLTLEPGTYWIDWQMEGGESAWANFVMEMQYGEPVTPSGNGRQLVPDDGWVDTGHESPFLVIGNPPPGFAGAAAGTPFWPESTVPMPDAVREPAQPDTRASDTPFTLRGASPPGSCGTDPCSSR